MQIRIKLKNNKLKKLPEAMAKAIQKGLQKGAFEVERKAKGYSPVDTGTMRRSIRTEPVKRNPDGWSVLVRPNVAYAKFMEKPGPVRLRGRRPFMKPALRDSIGKIKFHLIREIRRAI